MKKLLVLGALLVGAQVWAYAPQDQAAYERIEWAVAQSDQAIDQAQAKLKDRCNLTNYSALVTQVNGTNVWTKALQKALDEHEIVTIPKGNYYIDASVLIPSNRRIEADGAVVTLLPGTRVLMLRNANAPDGTLKPIPTTNRDSNIAIVGGYWGDWTRKRKGYGVTGRFDKDVREGGKYFGVSTLFYFGNCDDVLVKNVTFGHTSAFSVQAGDGSRHRYENIWFDTCYADGLHLNGNLYNVHVKNVRGHVGDDLVALNAYDWLNSSVNFGPQKNILCEDLELASSGGYPAIRIQPAKYRYADGSIIDCAISDVIFRRVKGIMVFKMYLQTPAYLIGQKPEWASVGSGGNLFFEDLDIDLKRPIDLFGGYETSDPLRGHFGAFEFGANLSSVHFRNIKIKFHLDKYPLSHLAVVGPKSGYFGDKPGGLEIFDPYVSCRVGRVTIDNLNVIGEKPKELVRATVFEDVNKDGNSSGRGVIEKIEYLESPKNVTGVSYYVPARNYQESSITGNGTLGAMARGRVANEVISLSHSRLYRPTPGKQIPTLVGLPPRRSGDQDRDRFMGACELRIDTPIEDVTDYVRRTDFLTGECIVEAKDKEGKAYTRRVVAVRPENVIAIKINDEKARTPDVWLSMIDIAPTHMQNAKDFEKQLPKGFDLNQVVHAYQNRGVKKIVCEENYYRCEYLHKNPWNPYAGYEVVFLKKASADGKQVEVVAAVELCKKGETSRRAELTARLEKALAKGYDKLLAEHAPAQKEIMSRLSFELTGPFNADKYMRYFQAGRYNIISSTGGDHIPNLQGLWTGAWDAPWYGSFTFNGNLPCAISFFTRGRTPELNECLLKWIEKRLPDMRHAAKFHYKARGFRIPTHATAEGGIEVNCSPQYPHIYWHGAAGWMLSRLYDGYRHTLDKAWLTRIYPLMKELTEYYEDVLVEMKDGTLGFNPSYSPENWPPGKSPVTINATIDNAIAKQFFDDVLAASEALSLDADKRDGWRKLRARLTPFAVSPKGFFAEWLAPEHADNNHHRHASHLYPLFDNSPAEIMTNAALVAAVKKSIDARMDFNEGGFAMAYGYVQNGLAACKVGDAELAMRPLRLLTAKSWLPGGGSCHDWENLFNTDISGGYPYLICDMLVGSDDKKITFLPAKPKDWTSGSLRGVLLRGNIILDELTWTNDTFTVTLKLPGGEQKKLTGKAGDTYQIYGCL